MPRDFSGVIVSVLRSGRGALVSLDCEVESLKYAVINERTEGRIDLMNGRGEFVTNTRVTGSGEVSVDGLRAVSIKRERQLA